MRLVIRLEYQTEQMDGKQQRFKTRDIELYDIYKPSLLDIEEQDVKDGAILLLGRLKKEYGV